MSTTKTRSKVKWEMVLVQVDRMIAASNKSLHERVVLLKQVWDDPGFLEYHKSDIDKAESHLNQKLGDYGITIFDAMAMLKYFPSSDDWEKNNIRTMLAYALEHEQAARDDAAPPKRERSGPVSRKEYEQAQEQLSRAMSRADQLAEENGRLREENAKLRSELDRAHGRIDELLRRLA